MEDYATIRRIKLEQCVQLATFQTDATQVRYLNSVKIIFENIFVSQQVRHAVILILIFVKVMRWIRDTEAMLIASFTIPGCLQEAEQLKKEHEQFQVAIEVCKQNVVFTIFPSSDVSKNIQLVFFLENSQFCRTC